MFLSATCESVAQKRTLSSLLGEFDSCTVNIVHENNRKVLKHPFHAVIFFFSIRVFLAGRELKRPKLTDAQRLQEAAIQLLEQQQSICSLFREVGVSEGR